MAGIGSQCRRLQRNHPPTCLSVGRVDVFPSAMDSGCEFIENITSGVVCCKKPETNNGIRSCMLPRLYMYNIIIHVGLVFM